MTDRIYAPWTDEQVAALNNFQRSGVMHPFTCGGEHELHQTLVAEPDGWHCPDEACDYRQTWAHSFMADPTMPGRLAASLPGFLARTAAADPMAAENKRLRQQLRETEDQLGAERRRSRRLADENAVLMARLTALEVHEAISRIPAPAAPACGETLYERPITDVPAPGML